MEMRDVKTLGAYLGPSVLTERARILPYFHLLSSKFAQGCDNKGQTENPREMSNYSFFLSGSASNCTFSASVSQTGI